MTKTIFTCQVKFENGALCDYHKVDFPERLIRFLNENRKDWRYMNVFEKDSKTGTNKGLFIQRIYKNTNDRFEK